MVLLFNKRQKIPNEVAEKRVNNTGCVSTSLVSFCIFPSTQMEPTLAPQVRHRRHHHVVVAKNVRVAIDV
jgi:hypothetical protein